MRKEKVSLEDWPLSDDYKLRHLEIETKLNFESTEKWLYLGADIAKPDFAKIGLTMGDLSSRSYSSGSPGYHLFCAFKCVHDITREKLKSIEANILKKFERKYIYEDGSTKRLNHYESGKPSECFQPVDFLGFFADLHSEIIDNHRDSFVICAKDDGAGGYYGEFVATKFNPRYLDHDKFIDMIFKF